MTVYAKVYLTKVYAPGYGPLAPAEKWIAIVPEDPGKATNAADLAGIKAKLGVKLGGLAEDDQGRRYRKAYKA